MWKFSLRFRRRLGLLGIAFAFLLPQLFQNMLRQKCDMIQAISWICVGIGVTIIAYIFLKPLSKETPPMDIAVRQSKTVWGLWFSGDRMLQKGLLDDYKNIKRILVMKPNSLAFEKNMEITGADAEKARMEILMLTKKAKEKGIDVRWYIKPEDFSVTLYDELSITTPNSEKAYVFTSEPRKGISREYWKGLMTLKKDDEAYYQRWLDKINKIWDSTELSEEPDKVMYEAVDMSEYENKRKKEKQGITKKQFHKLLDKASQPFKKSDKGKS